jgi:hypothetical protein
MEFYIHAEDESFFWIPFLFFCYDARRLTYICSICIPNRLLHTRNIGCLLNFDNGGARRSYPDLSSTTIFNLPSGGFSSLVSPVCWTYYMIGRIYCLSDRALPRHLEHYLCHRLITAPRFLLLFAQCPRHET